MAEANVGSLSNQQRVLKFPYYYNMSVVSTTNGNINNSKVRDVLRNATATATAKKAEEAGGDGGYYTGGAATFFTQNGSTAMATSQTLLFTAQPAKGDLSVPQRAGKDTDLLLRPADADPRSQGAEGGNTPPVTPPAPNPETSKADNQASDDSGQDTAGPGQDEAAEDNSNEGDAGPGQGAENGNSDGEGREGNGTGESVAQSAPTNKTIPKQIADDPNRRTYNPLRNYSSVTYVISLFALPPKALADFNRTGKWDTKNMELLIQSGGVNPSRGESRSPFFNYDFTIDDLEIQTIISTKETQYASNAIDFKFKVYEPYSMTFTTRLAEVQKILSEQIGLQVKQPVKALAAPLLLVVKFYGYDKDGNLAYTDPLGKSGPVSSMTTTQQGAFERAFPIFINKISFKLESKVTVYDVQAKSINLQTGFGMKRGVVDGDTNISAETVEDAISQLIASFNSKQKELSTGDNKQQEIPDEYSFKILDPLIANAFIADKNNVKSKSGMLPVKNTLEVNVQNSAKSYPVNIAKRDIHFASGTPILKALDIIISQSTYIGDSLTIVESEDDPPIESEDSAEVNPKPKQLYWYNITPNVTMKEQHDNIRNDYAYKIEYIIQPYRVPYVKTLSANNFVSYPGAHKEYSYFYTGENTEILAYEQQYNMLYYLAASSTTEAPIKNTDAGTSSKPKPTAGASPVGKESSKNEIVSNIMTFLYSPGDQIKAQIKILGDPDFLMPSIVSPSILLNLASRFYGPDFTINPNSGQVFIEIEFKQVEDYGFSNDGKLGLIENNDGLLTPNGNILFWDYPADVKGVSSNTMIFVVTHVLSRFSRGVFTQDLKTILPNFPKLTQSTNQGRLTETPVAVNVRQASQGDARKAEPADYGNPNISTSVTGKTPTSSLSRGVQQILNPPTQLENPTLTQLQNSPAYITARRDGKSARDALEIARQAFLNGTNKY